MNAENKDIQNKQESQKNNTQKHKYTNRLIHESSPYLLQHAHNPVDWYPWGKEALDKAKKENKPIIISIGYAACHWCHVMENETFEKEETAEIMNKYFVCIKVDREERPDIDQIYMDAAQLISGHGGWPLNAFATPEGKPFYAGTYFPKETWLQLLGQIKDVYATQPERVKAQAESLTDGIKTSGLIQLKEKDTGFTDGELAALFKQWENSMDYQWGGTDRAPKFPVPIGYRFLLNYYHKTQNPMALKAVTVTLDNMAMGGIYDQAGGGFARYSTDSQWKIPHFEKMLYDNAQLVSLYAKAFQLTKDPLYKQVVYETIDFVERELMTGDLEGGRGFYSSLDADSEGEEGKFYVWTKDELLKALADKPANDRELILNYYNITEKGNWEHGNNILYRRQKDEAFAKANNVSVEHLQKTVSQTRDILLSLREKRVRPPLDDKILTAWNAMMMTGYADAYRVFDDERFLNKALESARFIKAKMFTQDGLKRVYKTDKPTAAIAAFLDDYAFTIQGFTALYTATFDETWLNEAETLMQKAMDLFYDNTGGMFYYTQKDDTQLIARKMELMDNVIPASNSVMAVNLYVLGHYFHKEEYINKAKQMLLNMKNQMKRGGTFFGNWSLLMIHYLDEPYEVAVVGEHCMQIRKELDKHFMPNTLMLGGKTEGTLPLMEDKLQKGQTTIYVCKDKACRRPVTNTKEALKQLKINNE